MGKRLQTARNAAKKSRAPAPHRSETAAKAGTGKENNRLKRELAEALVRQKATGEILAAISRSKFDLQAVLDALVEAAATLTKADMAALNRPNGDVWSVSATYGFGPDAMQLLKSIPCRKAKVRFPVGSWHCGARFTSVTSGRMPNTVLLAHRKYPAIAHCSGSP